MGCLVSSLRICLFMEGERENVRVCVLDVLPGGPCWWAGNMALILI